MREREGGERGRRERVRREEGEERVERGGGGETRRKNERGWRREG